MDKLSLWETEAQSCWESQENCSECDMELPYPVSEKLRVFIHKISGIIGCGLPTRV